MHRAILLLLALVFPALAQDVRITEFMPVNTTGIQDQDGTFQPWIEIWNPNPAAKATLTNWRLVHSGTQWTFPSGMEIPPGEYLVVFASGKNRTTMTAPLHTNFTLNPAGGGPLQLIRSDASVASTFATYPALAADVSYGRDLAEINQIGSYTNPTPGDANNYSGSGVSGKVIMSVSGRAFTGSVSVALTEVTPVAGAVIRYTTNGTVPTSFSAQYGAPINVASTTLLRARVFEPGKLPGETESAGYLLLDGTTANFSTATPLIVVSNFGLGTFPDTGDQPAYMWVWEPGPDGRSRFSSLPTIATRCAVDRRGSSTLGNPKTNFNLEARKARDDDDRNISLLGMGNGSDWVFHAPYNFDRSLIHNPLMYALSNAIGRAAMLNRMAEVFVETSGAALVYTGSSSGDYYGIYNVMQKIRRGSDRIDVEQLGAYDNDPVSKTGGYIFKVDRQDSGDSGFGAGGATLAYYYPKEVEMKSPQRDPQEQYLTSYINSFKAALDSPNFANPVTGYAAWLDVPAAIDHHLLNVWSFNVDALRLSGYLHKPRGGKIVFGPIWDFDRALSSTDGRDSNPMVWRSQTGDRGTDFFNYQPWWNKIFTDLEFYQGYIDRWVELRRGRFSAASVNALIDALNEELTAEGVARDLARWGQGKRSWQSPFTGVFYGASQAAEIQRIKDYLQQRANFFDSQWVQPVAFNHDGGSVAPGTTLTLSAAAGSTIYYTLDGSDPRPSGGAVPNGPNVFTYSGPITVNAITRVKARAYNPNWTAFTGPDNPPLVSRWSGLRDVRVAISPAAVPGDLAVTEVNYHPVDPTPAELAIDPTFTSADFEFIELRNTANTAVDLNGLQIAIGARYTFTNDTALTLQPGEYLIVAANPAGLAARYGAVANVVGAFAGDLNNAGEQLTVLSASGAVIADFTYDDAWYAVTDGGGRSLEAIDQAQLSFAAGWHASWREGGTPGFEDVAAAFTADPEGGMVNPGEPITLMVEVIGSPAPTIQWRKNGEDIDGATGLTFEIEAATEDDEGTYDAVAENIAGPVVSAPAVIVVNDTVVFTEHPAAQTVNPGTLVTFTVAATGAQPFSYQWLKNGQPLMNENGATLSFTAQENDEGSYSVRITNPAGSETSNGGALLVNDPVVVLEDPESRTVNPQAQVIFSVTPGGTGPFGYQWRKGGMAIDGETGPQLVITSAAEGDEGTYDVVVTNMVNSVPSGGAVLQVNDPVMIVTDPLERVVNPNEPVTFTVEATGTGELQYQWRRNGMALDGETSAQLFIGAVTEAHEGDYDVVVSNIVGAKTSGAVALMVNDPVEFLVQPASKLVSPGGKATFSVQVAGTGPFTYQWRRNTGPIDGATSDSYTIPDAGEEHLGTYDVIVTNVVGDTPSASATLGFLDWNVAAGIYQGALQRTADADPAAALYPGRVTANVTKKGRVSGKLEFFGLTHPFRAQFDGDLHAEIPVPRRGDSNVVLILDLDGAAGTLDVSVTHPASPADYSAVTSAPQIPKRPRNSPAPLAGRYTMLLKPGEGAPADLEESGYVSIKIAPSGVTSWAGKLPDTSPVRGSGFLSPQNEVALSSSLYVRKPGIAGHLAGPITFDEASVSGETEWRKPPQTRGEYWRSGFTALTAAEGAPWQVPGRGAAAFDPGAMVFQVELNFSSNLSLPVEFTSLNKFIPLQGNSSRLRLKLNRNTGVLTGSYFDSSFSRNRRFEGVILQPEARGEGFAPGSGVIRQWELLPQ